jgi:peptidoglycan/LPS O-acetylase OafA/YrhL
VQLTDDAGARVPTRHLPLIDFFKALGCVLIVLHHLAFYGPMSDVVMQHWPGLIDALAEHGRLAVQLFLVCSGYLTAQSLSRWQGMALVQVLRLSLRRYLRLSVMLLLALSVTVWVSEALRPVFEHHSLSDVPTWPQALAHVFFLQHLLDLPALSVGVWYVAIDFQLYAITLLSLWAVTVFCRRHSDWRPEVLRIQVWLALTALSLLWWNLREGLDDYALYFFGSYGMGLLAWRARQSRLPLKGWVGLLLLGLLALEVDSRLRVATAWASGLLLAAAPERWMQAPQVAGLGQRALAWLADRSYAVFLIHFAVSLLVNALVTALWPENWQANAAGMLACVALAIAAGALLERLCRERRGLSGWALAVGVFLASTGLARLASG